MSTPESILFVVAAALIAPDGRVLLQQRSPGRSLAGLWEFPGGKVEPAETPEAALVRELHEELGIEVLPQSLKPAAFASEALGDRRLILLLYSTREWSGAPEPLDASALQWVAPEDMRDLPMPPADAPLVQSLIAIAATEPRLA